MAPDELQADCSKQNEQNVLTASLFYLSREGGRVERGRSFRPAEDREGDSVSCM